MAFFVLTVSLYQKTFSVTVKSSSSSSTIIKNYNLDPFRSITDTFEVKRKEPSQQVGGYIMTAKGKEEDTPQTASHPKPICQQPKEEHKPN
jgi:dimeric dUTPase (all-alpha-NTP-PPase superfamily)